MVGAPTLRAACLSERGLVRRENEDRCVVDEGLLLFGVADGLGGLPAGAEAAQAAVDELIRSMRGSADLAEAVQAAGRKVVTLGLRHSTFFGMATTLTVGQVRGRTLRIAHVGDSRCYLLRAQRLSLLTVDHTVGNEARHAGHRPSPLLNPGALTRCIGQPGPLRPDFTEEALETGDRVLFCTDGIYRVASESDIAGLLDRHPAPEACLEALVTLVLERGAPDNASAVALYVLPSSLD